MKTLRIRSTLAATVVVSAAATAHAQDGTPGVKLNMLRPPSRQVASPEAGFAPMAGSEVAFTLNFDGTVSPTHQALFNAAAAAWSSRIPFYRSGVTGPAAIVIDVREPTIDGPGGTLGQAGPDTWVNSGSFTVVATGLMEFDSADVPDLVSQGIYDEVIEHEMGHVLGIGTLWNVGLQDLYVDGSGQYTGANGLAAWKTSFSGQGAATFVPVELEGGSGTADGHWNENAGGAGLVGITEIPSGVDMQFETMTGWLNAPLHYSVLTHRSMADLGYQPTQSVPVPGASSVGLVVLAGMCLLTGVLSIRRVCRVG